MPKLKATVGLTIDEHGKFKGLRVEEGESVSEAKVCSCHVEELIAQGYLVVESFASGGSLPPGGLYMVGNGDPEMFIPNTSGVVEEGK